MDDINKINDINEIKEILCSGEMRIVEAKGEDSEKIPRFELLAYTGGKMRPSGWDGEVVVDLAGMEISKQKIPVRFNHREDQPVGHTEAISSDGRQLTASGVVSRTSSYSEDVVKAGKSGYPWQSSVGLRDVTAKIVRDGEKVEINGTVHEGPFYHVVKSSLKEISIVEMGGDEQTSAAIFAKSEESVEYSKDGQINKSERTEQKEHIMEKNDKQDEVVEASTSARDYKNVILEAKKEEQRQDTICAMAEKALEQGAPVDKVEALLENAIEDKKVTASSFERDLILVQRPTGGHTRRKNVQVDDKVIEAAFASVAGVNVEKHYDEKTLNAAQDSFKNGLSLIETLSIYAKREGWDGSYRDVSGILNAATSTYSVPTILSNVANKFLLDGYMAVEDSWSKIASVSSTRDFKEQTLFRLTGDLEFEKVGSGGEIKHGQMGELVYGNKVAEYGKQIAISRQDLINDDTSAFSQVARMIGRGGAIALNKLIWAEWQDDAAFFSVGNGNLLTGNDFDLDGVSALDTLFGNQADDNGNPLGVMPRILLVPNALKLAARQLINSTLLITGEDSTQGHANPLAGAYEIVSSTYLTNAKAYYLLANPQEISAIDVAFLHGVRVPTVQTEDVGFDYTGIRMRGIFDIGVRKQDFRAANKGVGA